MSIVQATGTATAGCTQSETQGRVIAGRRSMNIQKVEDHHHQGELAHVPQVAELPDVGAPRSNPLMMLWRRKNILLAVIGVCILASMVRYWLSPSIYRSEARLFVQVPGARGSDGAPATTVANALRTQCELMKSASMLANVLASPDLKDLKTFEDQSRRWTILKEHLNT